MARAKEEAQSRHVVLEAFLFESARDLQTGLNQENPDTADAADKDMAGKVADEDTQAECAKSHEDAAGEDGTEGERGHGGGDDGLGLLSARPRVGLTSSPTVSSMMLTRMWKNGTASIIMEPFPPLLSAVSRPGSLEDAAAERECKLGDDAPGVRTVDGAAYDMKNMETPREPKSVKKAFAGKLALAVSHKQRTESSRN